MKFIGIHTFPEDSKTWIEIGEYKNAKEAYEGMERNDSGLTVISERELEIIYRIVKNKKSPTNKLIPINEKSKVHSSFKKWQKQKKKELGKEITTKLVCDNCGSRFVAWVKETLPPCPDCGSKEVYEYATI